jgi:hypothetical protein
MPAYLTGMLNNLGQFEPIGLQLRTKKDALRAMRWMKSGGFRGCIIGRVVLGTDKPLVLPLDERGKEPTLGLKGHPALLSNSGYKLEAFDAFVAGVWVPA